MTRLTALSLSAVLGISALHCVGDEVGAGNPNVPDDASSSGTTVVTSGGPPNGDAASPDGATGLDGRVVDAVGLAAAGAEVVLVSSDGSEVAFTTDAKGAFRGAARTVPFDLKVRRGGSRYTHVFRGLTQLTPVLRMLGEYSVVAKTITTAIQLPNDVATPSMSLGLVGTDPLESAFRVRGSAVTSWSLNATSSLATLGVVLLSADVYAGSGVVLSRQVDFAAAPALTATPVFARAGIRAGLGGVTVGFPQGIKGAFAASKQALALGLAPSYAFTTTLGAKPFQPGGVPNVDGVKVTLEALGAADTFTLNGSRIATAPFSYRRRVEVGPDDVVDLALPSPAVVISPAQGETAVSTAPLFRVQPATSAGDQFVSIVAIEPKDAASTANRVVYHFVGAELQLGAEALSGNTAYYAEVTSMGPYASIDAYLEAGRRIPPEFLDGLPDRDGVVDFNALNVTRETATSDDGNLALTRSGRFDFTTGP